MPLIDLFVSIHVGFMIRLSIHVGFLKWLTLIKVKVYYKRYLLIKHLEF